VRLPVERCLRLLVCSGCCSASAFTVQTSRRAAAPSAPLFGDPLHLHSWSPPSARRSVGAAAAGAAAAAILGPPQSATAAGPGIGLPLGVDIPGFDASVLDPSKFQPVCPASDGFYRFGQSLVVGVVGQEGYKEYAPLIAGGLLRVRLELCVVESFFYEAIIPFIRDNGLSWVLPLHETVETFLAGTVFAVATNFILLGSTKIITVLATYADIFLGFPFRVVGGVGWRRLEDRALEAMKAAAPPEPPRPWWRGKKPRPEVPLEEVVNASSGTNGGKAQLAVWGSLLAVGQTANFFRQAVEAVDVFVGRYLLITTVTYVGIKFVHFKLFDPFP